MQSTMTVTQRRVHVAREIVNNHLLLWRVNIEYLCAGVVEWVSNELELYKPKQDAHIVMSFGSSGKSMLNFFLLKLCWHKILLVWLN